MFTLDLNVKPFYLTIDKTLSGATTAGQSGPGIGPSQVLPLLGQNGPEIEPSQVLPLWARNNGNEGVIHIPQSSRAIGLMSRVFINGLGDLGSIPGRVKPKTQKMVLDASLLNTQHYKVQIKGKVEQSRERN